MGNFLFLTSRNILATIIGMLHKFFAAGLQARDIYYELIKYF